MNGRTFRTQLRQRHVIAVCIGIALSLYTLHHMFRFERTTFQQLREQISKTDLTKEMEQAIGTIINSVEQIAVPSCEQKSIPEWQKEMERAIPEWQKECKFEDDFLVPLYKSSPNNHRDVKITLVSEFFVQGDLGMKAVRLNIQDNLHHARFVFLIGESKEYLEILLNMIPLSEINMEVYYAAGGVEHRHLFAAATRHSEPFTVHHADIAVGDMSVVIDACPNFDDAALVGTRSELYTGETSNELQTCTFMMHNGSMDTFTTNSKSFDCDILNCLQFKPFYWGAENVLASFLPKTIIANTCPHWRFDHYHDVNVHVRHIRPRINAGDNSWMLSSNNEDVLSRICDLEKLSPVT